MCNEIISVYDFNEPNGIDVFYVDRNIVISINNKNDPRYNEQINKLTLIKNTMGNKFIINPLLCSIEAYSTDNPNNDREAIENYQPMLNNDCQNLRSFFGQTVQLEDDNLKDLLHSPEKFFNHDFVVNLFSKHLDEITNDYRPEDYEIRIKILKKIVEEEGQVNNINQISFYMLYGFIYALYGNKNIQKLFCNKNKKKNKNTTQIVSNAFFDFFYGSFLFLIANEILKYNLKAAQKISSINFITFDQNLQKLFQIMSIKDVFLPLEERKNYPGLPEAKFELPQKEYLTQCYDKPIPKEIGEELLYTGANSERINLDNYTEYDFLSDYCCVFNFRNTCNHLNGKIIF